MSETDFDFLVIGAGSGGVRASRVAAKLGAKTALCEAKDLGGTCVNAGCVPKKLFVYASEAGSHLRDARGYGWMSSDVSFDWPTLLKNKDTEITRLNGIYARLVKEAGVTLLNGFASFIDPHTVDVAGKTYRAKHILIATGGKPWIPDIPGAHLAITSDEAFHLPELPSEIVIIGGGYIASEFAGIFNGLGVKVTQLYRGELFLRGFDRETREHLAEEMKEAGIDLRFDTDVVALEKSNGRIQITLRDGSALTTDAVLYATGRRPLTDGLNLPQIGVRQAANGAIEVNEHLQTSLPHIYAVGDVIDRVALTPVAIVEGTQVARALFANATVDVSYDNIASAIFTQPPLASVGLSEEQARQSVAKVDIYKARFRPMRHTLTGRRTRMFMKLIVDAQSDRVLGCHMVGEHAAEIIQSLATGITAGITKTDFDRTMALHPSAAEEFVTMSTPS